MSAKPLKIKIELEKSAMKDLLAKLKLAGIKVPLGDLGVAVTGKGTLEISIHEDTYESVLNVILGHIMVFKSLDRFWDTVMEFKKPTVIFNKVKIAGDK